MAKEHMRRMFQFFTSVVENINLNDYEIASEIQ